MISTRWLLGAAAFVLFGWLLVVLSPVLTPFLAAAGVAYVLNPAVTKLNAWHYKRFNLSRSASSAVVMLLSLLTVFGVLLLVYPVLSAEAKLLQAKLPAFIELLNTRLLPWLAQHFGLNISLDAANAKALLGKLVNFDELPALLFAAVKSSGLALIGGLGLGLLVPVIAFYFLLDWPQIVHKVRGLIPRSWLPTALAVGGEINTTMAQYLRGQLAVMGILAVYYSVALWLAGFDVALPVGVLTGLLVVIPYLGFGLGLILALIAAALQFDGYSGLLWVALIYGAGQVLEGFFLTPRLVGASLGLHPIAVIFALLAFGQLLGFTGVLLALPFAAVILVVAKRLLAVYRASRFYQER